MILYTVGYVSGSGMDLNKAASEVLNAMRMTWVDSYRDSYRRAVHVWHQPVKAGGLRDVGSGA